MSGRTSNELQALHTRHAVPERSGIPTRARSVTKHRAATYRAVMRAVAVVVLAGVAGFALAACGSGAKLTAHYTTTPPTAGDGRAMAATPVVSVAITVRTRDMRARRWTTRRYTLTCEPAGGTIPSRQRLCADISKHPVSMLAPPRRRWTCSGSPFMPTITVQAVRQGRRSRFVGAPGCDWPGGTSLDVYYAAVRHDAQALALAEPRLRCDDDPRLFVMPTPRASAVACVHGLWTPRSERLIKLAEQTAPIPALGPRGFFPRDIGVQRCTIRSGGALGGRSTIKGHCGVAITGIWRTPVVTLIETWAASHVTRRHRWRITIRDGHGQLTAQNGPTAPQSRR
jgi:hypothetical protein